MTTKRARKPAAIKQSMTGIGRRLTHGADRVAEIIVEDEPGSPKGKMIADETAQMFKGMKKQFKENTKDVQPQDLIDDAAFCVGRASGVVSRAIRGFFKDSE
ncbi:MAG: hypothetical protein HQL22_06005 [Candidatus Omnitrophica bacterium]|nr:hypothetical protein [Candidatus Omnitrophota bacterium]